MLYNPAVEGRCDCTIYKLATEGWCDRSIYNSLAEPAPRLGFNSDEALHFAETKIDFDRTTAPASATT
jgi:hypothetical protein